MMWPSDWVRPSAELVARLSRLACCSSTLTALTDGTVLRGADGSEARRFSVIDGHGLGMLRDDGMIVGVVSREDSAITRARMESCGPNSRGSQRQGRRRGRHPRQAR